MAWRLQDDGKNTYSSPSAVCEKSCDDGVLIGKVGHDDTLKDPPSRHDVPSLVVTDLSKPVADTSNIDNNLKVQVSGSTRSRIIVGWNQDDVDLTVVAMDDQMIHTCIRFKIDKKDLFCSFIYAHNRYTQRRPLWRNLIIHKHYVRNRPWCLLGDFYSALNLEDTVEGSSVIDIAMREFKECVEVIEVFDVNRSGLQFTWNQKPRGTDGKLKKIDRIMANLACTDAFIGAHAIFQPYRISDHSPAILTIPTSHKFTPKPFKFYNIIVQNSQFKGKVKEFWDMNVSGFHMYKVVSKLKSLKKPLRVKNTCSSPIAACVTPCADGVLLGNSGHVTFEDPPSQQHVLVLDEAASCKPDVDTSNIVNKSKAQDSASPSVEHVSAKQKVHVKKAGNKGTKSQQGSRFFKPKSNFIYRPQDDAKGNTKGEPIFHERDTNGWLTIMPLRKETMREFFPVFGSLFSASLFQETNQLSVLEDSDDEVDEVLEMEGGGFLNDMEDYYDGYDDQVVLPDKLQAICDQFDIRLNTRCR
ncbi:RNA-directed DNA polymerase, eukaryota, Reverse transcriptase zinc-binding domain protein [Artemisia annua]|uniref:RNA-directed DNA polymerase, eukaryota, Reverse transcriptase zinc-binding domain protein n=1 Tax=Artemisia annua TaxID=35608 RepID=A0A2U1NIU8_ARTAN|nr:RNA-directed DNA polymerase, eukaryota, Reverse transcriptase zinc-binding domain protein [Artemisia annua]